MPREHPLSPHRLIPLVLVAVLAVLAIAAVAGPRWYRKLYYPLEYREVIGAAATRWRVDPYLLTAVVHAESGFDPETISPKGAIGLMQVMPETAHDLRRERVITTKVTTEALQDPKVNVELGAAYLAKLRERYDADDTMALAAYNAGSVNADRWKREGGDARIDFPQTKHYVEKVQQERRTYEKLYPEAYPK